MDGRCRTHVHPPSSWLIVPDNFRVRVSWTAVGGDADFVSGKQSIHGRRKSRFGCILCPGVEGEFKRRVVLCRSVIACVPALLFKLIVPRRRAPRVAAMPSALAYAVEIQTELPTVTPPIANKNSR
jgi:hypothetical protein